MCVWIMLGRFVAFAAQVSPSRHGHEGGMSRSVDDAVHPAPRLLSPLLGPKIDSHGLLGNVGGEGEFPFGFPLKFGQRFEHAHVQFLRGIL